MSGPEIERQISLGNIVIDPFDPQHVGPNSVDVHLGHVLYVYGGVPVLPSGWLSDRGGAQALDPKALPDLIEVPRRPDGRWILFPGHLYLGSTIERTETYGFVPVIDGRSSLGRLGVFAHITAGRGDDAFVGSFTVEIAVVEPVILEPGGRYFQISYLPVVGKRRPYQGRYQGDDRPVASRIHVGSEG